jgi:DNA primase
VILPADGDRAGKELADAMSADLPQLQVVRMPNELDANDVLRTEGVEAFLSRCSIEESEHVPS